MRGAAGRPLYAGNAGQGTSKATRGPTHNPTMIGDAKCVHAQLPIPRATRQIAVLARTVFASTAGHPINPNSVFVNAQDTGWLPELPSSFNHMSRLSLCVAAGDGTLCGVCHGNWKRYGCTKKPPPTEGWKCEL